MAGVASLQPQGLQRSRAELCGGFLLTDKTGHFCTSHGLAAAPQSTSEWGWVADLGTLRLSVGETAAMDRNRKSAASETYGCAR